MFTRRKLTLENQFLFTLFLLKFNISTSFPFPLSRRPPPPITVLALSNSGPLFSLIDVAGIRVYT